MLSSWILSKLDPLIGTPLIILRDPQRMIQRGAQAVDGWGEQNKYSVFFCTGNLGLRDMYEWVRDAPDVRVLLVDRSRKDPGAAGGGQGLFYPDLEAAIQAQEKKHASNAARGGILELSLRDFFVEHTSDNVWPYLVEDRNLARLLLGNLPSALEAHAHLRQVSASRFSDTDLYKIVLGAALHINPFKKLNPSEIRRLCIEQHATLEEINRYLPADVMAALRTMIESVPKPFCWLLDRDPDQVIRAFTLAAILHQHNLNHALLIANLDPTLHEYREIDAGFLDSALQDQLSADPDRVSADVNAAEAFLAEDKSRLALLLRDQLELDQPQKAFLTLQRERLSPLIRSLALVSLLVDLISQRDLKFHSQVLQMLDKQELDTKLPALIRPSEQWQMLRSAYRRAVEVYRLMDRVARLVRTLQLKPVEELQFGEFDRLWNEEHLNRLDFYLSDLDRMLRVADMLPVPHASLWPELEAHWNNARQEFKESSAVVDIAMNVINRRFQDMYRQQYSQWIQQSDAPAVFTHQFLSRMLKAYWDPKSGRKAVILVFDGMRTDAWDEFLRPVLEERFEVIAVQPGSAILPTETELSRKAISAGCLPADFPIKSRRELELLRAWLKSEMNLSPSFEVIRDDDTTASGMVVRYDSPQIEYIVFNFTDENLHGNPHDLAFIYNSIVHEIIRQDVRAVLRDLPDNALIFVTSDHGFTPFPSEPIDVSADIVADTNLVKYRVVRGSALFSGDTTKKVASFEIKGMRIPIPDPPRQGAPIQYIHFPRPGFVFRRDTYRHAPDKYGHGGLSLAECMVPMVVLGPPQKDQGLLLLAELRQVGSVLENEPLEVEIVVRSTQMVLQDLAISLSFNLQELATPRKEIFSGVEETFRVQWTPILPEITPEQRDSGQISIPLTVALSYQHNGKAYKTSRSTTLTVKLDTTRLRRRLDSKLDLLMGKVPKELKG